MSSAGTRTSSRVTSSSALSTSQSSETTSSGTSTSSDASTSSGSPRDRPSVGNNNAAGGNTSSPTNLYLYTFVVTIVLLLSVTIAAVIRARVLRRRFRRLRDEAIRNGTWIPPPDERAQKVDPNDKPKMYDVYIDGVGVKGAADWSDVKPISASPSGSRGDFASSKPEQPSPSNGGKVLSFLHRQRAQPTSSSPSDDIPLQQIPDSSLSQLGRVQLSFLVAMPSPDPIQPPAHSDERNDDDTKLPDLQIGLVDIPVKSTNKPESATTEST